MGAGRHRWEFMILPGESAEQVSTDAFIEALLEPWNVKGAVRLERKAVYTFRARIAAQWRKGRIDAGRRCRAPDPAVCRGAGDVFGPARCGEPCVEAGCGDPGQGCRKIFLGRSNGQFIKLTLFKMAPQTETKAGTGFKAGVKDYRLTYYTPDYQVKDTDILAAFRMTPQPGVPAEEAGAAVAAESSTGTWTTVWTDGLTSLDRYKGRCYGVGRI